MARLIRHDQMGPYRIEKASIEGDVIWICGCGRSKEYPICDRTHLECGEKEEPDKLYYWDGDTPREVNMP